MTNVEGWSYQQCQQHMQTLLEMSTVTGAHVNKIKDKVKSEDDIDRFMDSMRAYGWSREVTIQCRNGAASKAFRKTGPQSALRKLQNSATYVG